MQCLDAVVVVPAATLGFYGVSGKVFFTRPQPLLARLTAHLFEIGGCFRRISRPCLRWGRRLRGADLALLQIEGYTRLPPRGLTVDPLLAERPMIDPYGNRSVLQSLICHGCPSLAHVEQLVNAGTQAQFAPGSVAQLERGLGP